MIKQRRKEIQLVQWAIKAGLYFNLFLILAASASTCLVTWWKLHVAFYNNCTSIMKPMQYAVDNVLRNTVTHAPAQCPVVHFISLFLYKYADGISSGTKACANSICLETTFTVNS